MEDFDSKIEKILWENGEGCDLIINGLNETQFISLGENDIEALKIIL